MLGSGNAIGQTALYGRRPSFIGALDVFAPLYAGAGLKRMRAGYTGELIVARRSTDNDEEGFKAGADGWVDAVAFMAWLGGASAFLKTAFDQEGNGRHISQATAAAQPRLALDGVRDVGPAGHPVMLFDGVNDYLTMASATGVAQAVAALTVATVAGTTNEGTSPILFGCTTATGSTRFVTSFGAGTAGTLARRTAATGIAGASQTKVAGIQRVIGRALFAAGTADTTVNGATASVALSGTPAASENTASNLAPAIGVFPNYGGQFLAGPLAALIVAQTGLDIAACDRAMQDLMP